jgi:hypothetical protein
MIFMGGSPTAVEQHRNPRAALVSLREHPRRQVTPKKNAIVRQTHVFRPDPRGQILILDARLILRTETES